MFLKFKQKAIVSFVLITLLLTFAFANPIILFAIPENPPPGNEVPQEDPRGDSESGDSLTPQTAMTLEEKQALARQVLEEIDQLAVETEMLIEEYNGVQESLKQIEMDLMDAQRDYDEANERYTYRQNIFKNRIKSMYRNGTVNFLEVLLSTTSFTDFLTRVQFLSFIAQNDSDLADRLLKERTQLRTIRDKQEQLRQERIGKLQELQAKRVEIEAKLREHEQYLWKVEKDIQDLITAELQKKAEKQAQLFEQLKREAAVPDSGLSAMLDPSSIVYTTMQYLGIPYLWGGEKPDTGFDCSGLVLYVFRQHGVVVPHYSGWQFKMGTPVEKEELKPGDLVFFGSPIHHVGIYIGGRYMIHAPQTGDIVKISDFTGRKDYAGARRFPLLPRE